MNKLEKDLNIILGKNMFGGKKNSKDKKNISSKDKIEHKPKKRKDEDDNKDYIPVRSEKKGDIKKNTYEEYNEAARRLRTSSKVDIYVTKTETDEDG